MIIRQFLTNAFFLVLLAMAACKSAMITQADLPAAGSNPNSCRVEGVVVSINKILEADTGTICSKYPCRAMVKVISVSACGSSFSNPFNAGDTVEMRFVYTLDN